MFVRLSMGPSVAMVRQFVSPTVRRCVPHPSYFQMTKNIVTETKEMVNNIRNIDSMRDDLVVASYLSPRYLLCSVFRPNKFHSGMFYSIPPVCPTVPLRLSVCPTMPLRMPFQLSTESALQYQMRKNGTTLSLGGFQGLVLPPYSVSC